jgi:hypothetical protein
MNNGSDYDFIIIGSGAGGGTLAYHLAPSGKKILPDWSRFLDCIRLPCADFGARFNYCYANKAE